MKSRQLHLFGIKINKEKKIQKEGIIIPVDTTILMGVVIILLFVLAFAWGIERGRKLAGNDLKKEKLLAQAKENSLPKIVLPSEAVSLNDKPGPGQKKEKKENRESTELKEAKEEVEKQGAEKKEALYRIQVASFVTQSSAQKEAERLKEKGFPVIVNQSGRHSVVYVGNFSDKKKAESAFEDLKKIYHDCILRRL